MAQLAIRAVLLCLVCWLLDGMAGGAWAPPEAADQEPDWIALIASQSAWR